MQGEMIDLSQSDTTYQFQIKMSWLLNANDVLNYVDIFFSLFFFPIHAKGLIAAMQGILHTVSLYTQVHTIFDEVD